jgi:transposase InsO family protein
LWQQQLARPLQYPEQQFDNIPVLSFQPAPNAPWKICIPTQQLEDVTSWFHLALNHCGQHRLLTTMGMHLYHPRLHSVAEQITKNCDTCQRKKLPGPEYVYMPLREANILPREEVALDLISPWTLKVAAEAYKFYALTCIDTVTNFLDAIRLHDKTASHIGMQFENLWLSQYPRPVRCLHDHGTEFIRADFQRILQHFGIKDVAISVRNPQANAVCKRLHQSVGNALCVFLSQGIPFNVHNVAELVDSALATALHDSWRNRF